MRIKDVIKHIETLAPLAYAEDFDNVGLLTGDETAEVNGVLITLDTLENVVQEAIEKKCNLIVSFHPIIFSGLKKITGKNYVERVLLKAIKNDIAIYAIHTALDNSFEGVNAKICQVLELRNKKILIPQSKIIKKLITFVPKANAIKLRTALFEVGAGTIGNYDHCSFNTEGIGTFRGNETTNPHVGTIGQTHYEEETRIEVVFSKHIEKQVIQALFENHPYEEIAYDIVALENTHPRVGMGMVGEVEKPTDELEFLKFLKQKLDTGCIRYSALRGKKVKKVAVLGGSGSFALEHAKAAGADVFVTSDFKYHEFYRAEGVLIIADVGHYESEKFTKNLLSEYLRKKIPKFAVVLSEQNTNPINYL